MRAEILKSALLLPADSCRSSGGGTAGKSRTASASTRVWEQGLHPSDVYHPLHGRGPVPGRPAKRPPVPARATTAIPCPPPSPAARVASRKGRQRAECPLSRGVSEGCFLPTRLLHQYRIAWASSYAPHLVTEHPGPVAFEMLLQPVSPLLVGDGLGVRTEVRVRQRRQRCPGRAGDCAGRPVRLPRSGFV